MTIEEAAEKIREEAIKEETRKMEQKFQAALPPPPEENRAWEKGESYTQMEFEDLRRAEKRESEGKKSSFEVSSDSSSTSSQNSWSSSWNSRNSYSSSSKDYFSEDVDKIARSAYGSKTEQSQNTERGRKMRSRFKNLMKSPAFQGALLVAAIAATKGLLWFLYKQASNRNLDFAGKI